MKRRSGSLPMCWPGRVELRPPPSGNYTPHPRGPGRRVEPYAPENTPGSRAPPSPKGAVPDTPKWSLPPSQVVEINGSPWGRPDPVVPGAGTARTPARRAAERGSLVSGTFLSEGEAGAAEPCFAMPLDGDPWRWLLTADAEVSLPSLAAQRREVSRPSRPPRRILTEAPTAGCGGRTRRIRVHASVSWFASKFCGRHPGGERSPGRGAR